MNRFIKNISPFFLLFAVLSLSAHQIIPHDHHLADAASNQDKNCPASNNKSNHNPGFPIHCHAFNDLASEKARPVQISPEIKNNLSATNSFSSPSVFEKQSSRAGIIDLQNPVFDSFALDLSLLRAPPVA